MRLSNLVNMKNILVRAKKDGYAVGQFNINSYESLATILKVCNLNNSPVIIGVSVGAKKYLTSYALIASMVKEIIIDKKYKIPVVLHLDHAKSFDECKKAIDEGFTSVMIDGSTLPLAENIKLTRKVVDYALRNNVSVEAEIGNIGDYRDKKITKDSANYQEAVSLVNETNIDALAAAVGTIHGNYEGEIDLDFDLIEKLADDTLTPLVLHGGSGVNDILIKKAISKGVCKINVNTELQQAWTKGVSEIITKEPKTYDPREINLNGMKEMEKVVLKKIKLFKSINKV